MNLPPTLSTLGRRLRERPELILLVVSLLWVVWAAVDLAGVAAGGTGTDTSLLRGLEPVKAPHVKRPAAMTDGIVPKDGDGWDTDLTSTFMRPGFVVFDLGQATEVKAAFVHGDGNDDYELSISDDGVAFEPLWKSGPAQGNGMRPRSTTDLDGKGRFIRLAARGGDGRFAVGELQVFREVPSSIPSSLTAKRGLPTGERVRGHLLHFVLAMGLFLFAARRSSPVWWKVLAAAAPLAAGAMAVNAFAMAWPVGALEVSMARAVSAGIASIAILREVVAPKRYPASRAMVIAALTLSAGLAVGSFYNLGHLQFTDHANDRRTFVHTFDMRVYYPVAKYFPELRFDGLYLASLAAYVQDRPGTTRAKVAKVQFRDLKTHRMVRADEVWDQVLAMEGRFSPERWQAFLKDMRYFRLTMGRDYLGSMVDHGGNATPVWLAATYLAFNLTEATETTLVVGGLLDPILLLIAFIALGRAYGWRASLLCAVIWGANDFVMLGSNWAGATLRHDWLAYLLLAIAALKKERWILGGVLLAMASAARAFPALALIGMAFPMLGWLVDRVRAENKWPTLREWIAGNRNIFVTWASAAAGGVALFLFSSAVLGFDAWPEWLAKVRLLDSEPHLNQVSLESLVAGTDYGQRAVLAARKPLYYFIAAAFVVGAGYVGHRRSPDQAAILGCLFIPLLFNPANYYIHFITMLPLLAWTGSRKQQSGAQSWNQAVVGFAILGLCIAQYWTTKVPNRTLHFEMATAMLFTAFAVILVACYRQDKQDRLARGRPDQGDEGPTSGDQADPDLEPARQEAGA